MVTQPSQLQIFTSSTPDINSQGNGSATIDSITGGTPFYNIIGWSNGATGYSVTGLAAGTYTVTITDINGCEQTANVVVSFVPGISDSENGLNFTIYSNPANSGVNIILGEAGKDNGANLSIKDILGHVMIAKTISGTQVKVDVSNLANGLYEIELNLGGRRAVKQIVINK